MSRIDLIFDKERLLNTTLQIRNVDKVIPNAYGETKAIYIKGEPYNDRDTWNFAYVGVPNMQMPDGGFPAIVVLHGGGGCAFHEWVEFWNKKGYVAIAPDLSGQHNGDKSFDGKGAPVNPEGGPKGYRPFQTTIENCKDMWIYHSVCNAINAHNYLREMPQVNKEKVAITGISWGSVVTMMTGGVDDRFKCFAPVYGGGFLFKNPIFLLEAPAPSNEQIWLEDFDPSSYLKRNFKPIMFTSGVDDPAFSIICNSQSWDMARGDKYYSWRHVLEHYHRWKDEEQMINVYRFIEKILFDRSMPIEITYSEYVSNRLSVKVTDSSMANSAIAYYTLSEPNYENQNLVWESVVANKQGCNYSAEIPIGAKFCFMEISDGQEIEFIISSKMYSSEK